MSEPLTIEHFEAWVNGPFAEHSEQEAKQDAKVNAFREDVKAVQNEFCALMRLLKTSAAIIVLFGGVISSMSVWAFLDVRNETKANREAIIAISTTLKILIERDRTLFESLKK